MKLMILSNDTPVTSTDDGIYEAALALYDASLNVFPIPRGSKAPFGKHGFLQATRLSRSSLTYLMPGSNLAVKTGRLSQNLVVIDCDSVESFLRVGDELRKRGIAAWIRNSVRGGQYWLRCAEGEVSNQKEPNIDILGNGLYTLAPPSVHPTGMLYEWLQKSDALPPRVSINDLNFLSRPLTLASRPHEASTVLPAVAHRVLIEQDTTPWNGDNSRAEFAACLALIGAGYDDATILSLFGEFSPPHFRKVGKASFVRAILTPARSKHVPIAPRKAEDASPGALVAARARAASWPGRTGNTDYAVLLALCKRQQRDGTATFRASLRELAELSQVHRNTVPAALKRLIAGQWIRQEMPNRTTGAHCYSLVLTAENTTKVNTLVTVTPTVGVGKPTGTNSHADHDAWFPGALGKSARRCYEHLLRQDQTVAELGASLGRTLPTVRRALKRLQQHGLARKSGRVWSAQPTTAQLDAIATQCHTLGKTRLRREQHQQERERWASTQMERQRRRWQQSAPQAQAA